jgi:hypothetical protein
LARASADQSWGEPYDEMRDYHRLMRDRYGVIVSESGCVVTDEEVRAMTAYNWYSERRLRARFNRDAAQECWQDAMSQLAKSH